MFLVFLLIFIGVCEFLAALSLDIQCRLDEISEEITKFDGPFDFEKIIELKMKLNDAIKFHSESLR